jgi:hypothetical protein
MPDSAYGGPLLTACRGRQIRHTERRIKTHLLFLDADLHRINPPDGVADK